MYLDERIEERKTHSFLAPTAAGARCQRALEEAERFKADDEAVAKRVGAKNEVENYAYSVRNATREDGVKDKLSEDELKTVNDAVEECINWLDANSLAEVE